MSNNQKQAPTGAPQQQPRFTQGPYTSRVPTPQRSDAFHVTPSPAGFVAQQGQNQPPNQGGSIRGMAPTGPPTQASTPPQSEQMKQMQQQQGQLPLAYVTQPVRSNQGYHYRTPPPNAGGPRMTNHHRQVPNANQIYTQHVPMYTSPMGQPMATYQLPLQPYGNAPRAPYFPQQFTHMLPNTYMHGSFPTQQPQAPQTYFPTNFQQAMPIPARQGPPGPTVPSAPQGPTQPQPPSMTPSLGVQQQPKKKKRDKAIPIINPHTGKNINDEDESLPPSGESSARETPQPNSNMMAVADFAARVAIAASEGKMETPEIEPVIFQQNTQPLDGEHMQKMENVVQNSKLQVSTKEFVPEVTKHVPKENCTSIDSNRVEVPVVLSPAKSKPSKQQQAQPQAEPAKEMDNLYVNQEMPHETQIEVQKVNKVVKNKSESGKPVELPAKEALPVEETVDKRKNSQQKAKEATPAPAAAAKQSAPVPGSQPPKPTSKGNKMRELNMKGANKEGTDMDSISSVEAPAATENCNQQAQLVPQPQKVTPTENVAPVIETLPPVTTNAKPAEVKTKNKVDVTSIVKDVPKNAKPFVAPAPVMAEAQDETDRAATDKLVQVKNEANIKASADNNDNQVLDKNVIRYKKDQWSPFNTTGKKCYDREFLINLQNDPKSRKKPDNLPDLDVVLKDNNRSRMLDPRSFTMNRQSEVLMPAFHKSLSQRGTVTKRSSQQGKAGSKSGKPNAIHVTLSLKEDVKLRETENAWRPARLNSNAAMTEDEMKTALLYKKVRGVLNKLTPEKFDKLLNQVQDLTIDNAERLQGVIDLVFEKAVDEPNFSVAYALMCKELAMMQVPAERKGKNDTQDYVNFRKLLITRCQLEFEKNSIDENSRNAKLKEIEESTDPERKKELQLILEEEDRKMRVKSVGNIRFIGELFKQQMLTVNIMLRCMNILLDNRDEDSLECLCKLLTTIGKDLEVNKKQNLQTYFHTMQEIVDKKHGKISSRVRFMLQDVIDLRSSKWVPRRQDLNPKTMEQIQKEADTEQLNIQVLNSGPINTPRKDDNRLGGSVGGSDRKRRNNATDEGWSMATSRGRAPYTVESAKLMIKLPPMDEMTLGSKNLFGQWGRGSNIKTQSHTPVTNTSNMYAALENINADQDKSRTGFDSRLKDPYVSKGPSMERSYKQNYEDGRGSRSGSQHRNSQQRPAPSPSPSMKREPQQPTPPPQSQVPQLTSEQFKLKIHNILDEYWNECISLDDCVQEIKQYIDLSKMDQFISQGYNEVLDSSSKARHKTSLLFAHLIKIKLLPLDHFTNCLKVLLTDVEEQDLVIDIPKVWDYLAEIIFPLIVEDVLQLNRLCGCMEALIANSHSHKLLAQLFKLLMADKGPSYVKLLWQSSDVSITDFMAADLVESFIEENNFVIGGAGTPLMQSSLSWEQIHNKLLEFLKTDTSFDEITEWISANVGERVRENLFIRTLVTAICENSVYTVNNTKKLKIELLLKCHPLLQRYVDAQEPYELQCLFALQALVHKWEHPPGLLLNILEKLWEDGYISNESLLAWQANKDPAEVEGKAVALCSLSRLFTEINEGEDSQTSESEDA